MILWYIDKISSAEEREHVTPRTGPKNTSRRPIWGHWKRGQRGWIVDRAEALMWKDLFIVLYLLDIKTTVMSINLWNMGCIYGNNNILLLITLITIIVVFHGRAFILVNILWRRFIPSNAEHIESIFYYVIQVSCSKALRGKSNGHFKCTHFWRFL